MRVIQLPTKEKKKGNEAEDHFREWLDKNGIAYLPFCENEKKLSLVLKKHLGAKRPDFMLLFRTGFLFVDVKHKDASFTDPSTFLVGCDYTEQYFNLYAACGIEVWYAFSNRSSEYQEWYWIPATEVERMARRRIRTAQGDCHVMPRQACTRIGPHGPLDKLFERLLLFK